jgi:hypothetical protein
MFPGVFGVSSPERRGFWGGPAPSASPPPLDRGKRLRSAARGAPSPPPRKGGALPCCASAQGSGVLLCAGLLGAPAPLAPRGHSAALLERLPGFESRSFAAGLLEAFALVELLFALAFGALPFARLAAACLSR